MTRRWINWSSTLEDTRLGRRTESLIATAGFKLLAVVTAASSPALTAAGGAIAAAGFADAPPFGSAATETAGARAGASTGLGGASPSGIFVVLPEPSVMARLGTSVGWTPTSEATTAAVDALPLLSGASERTVVFS